jgi:hypothetical protein
VRTQVLPSEVACRRRLEPVRGAQHRGCKRLDACEWIARRPQRFEGGNRLAVAQPHRLLFDALGGLDRPAAQPPFEEVDVRAAEAGVRGAQIGVEVAPRAAERGETEQRDQRLAVGCPVELLSRFECVGHPERAERGFQRRLPPLQRRTHDEDGLGRRAVPKEVEELLRKQLERTPRAAALEEANGAVDGGRRKAAEIACPRKRTGGVLEQVPLHVCDRGLGDLGEPWRQLLDTAVRESGEIVHRTAERRERCAVRLVRDRHRDVRAPREAVQ